MQGTLEINVNLHNVLEKIQRIQRCVRVKELAFHQTTVHVILGIQEINVNLHLAF
jgi:hypothetical protein